jgi:zinc D-Ala-D-Ala carboxypeptidase
LAEKQNTTFFQNQIQNISSTVGVLEKLSKTDPELLQKYSKVYFLNENYTPAKLTEIDTKFLYLKETPLQIHSDVWPHLKQLLDKAESDGIDLKIISAYRSFATQAILKSGYKVYYGTGANTFSADQGYSEHQLGTTIDFTTKSVGSSFSGFDKTPAYAWLTSNAYKYGFILSYPKNNTYYIFEPWHFRYVGVMLATQLHDQNLHFYDLDQRVIDQYLVNIFD